MEPSGAGHSHDPPPRTRRPAMTLDPQVVAAAAEVDRGLLRWMLGLTHRERLRAASNAARTLSRFRRGSA